MSFCEKCRYIRGITKSETNSKSHSKISESLDKIFDKFTKKEEITEDDLKKIKATDILSDDRYDLIKGKDQKKLVSIIKAIDKNFFVEDDTGKSTSESQGATVAYFSCKFCNNSTKIQPGTVIYLKKFGLGANNAIEDYTYVVHDNSLARTHTYICKNTKCPTHKDLSVREAILIYNLSEQLVYICTACNTSWINSV